MKTLHLFLAVLFLFILTTAPINAQKHNIGDGYDWTDGPSRGLPNAGFVGNNDPWWGNQCPNDAYDPKWDGRYGKIDPTLDYGNQRPSRRQTPENTDFDTMVDRDIDNVKIRNSKKIEELAAKYVASYDAYVTAKNSTKKEVREKTGEYLQKYRKAYADFIKILREDNIYDPKLPKNHAGVYNQKYNRDHQESKLWSDEGLRNLSQVVKDMVEAGANLNAVNQMVVTHTRRLPGATTPSEIAAAAAAAAAAAEALTLAANALADSALSDGLTSNADTIQSNQDDGGTTIEPDFTKDGGHDQIP